MGTALGHRISADGRLVDLVLHGITRLWGLDQDANGRLGRVRGGGRRGRWREQREEQQSEREAK